MTESSDMEFLDHTLAVIVVFGRKVSDTPAWVSLVSNVSGAERTLDVLIYDNSPHAQKSPSHHCMRIHYMHDGANPGVSKAYNVASGLASQYGKNWLLLLDQDTSIPDHGLAAYGNTLSSHPDGQFFVPRVNDEQGLLSPFRFHWGGGKRLTSHPGSTVNLKLNKVINSGMLVSTDLFQKANGYNESIPLDFSDFAFCDRLAPHSPFGWLVDISLKTQFSSHVALSLDEAVQRFSWYCTGSAKYAATRKSGRMAIGLRKFLRALKLTLTYRNLRFIYIASKS